ncbi:MAG: SDR family oxidoreductase [Desulfobacterales bacterium]|nr:SDR family oxidoreductase [Desulfobacterales bacterium]
MELRGCAAIVTGGSGGLGQRICRALALSGVNVVVNYAQSKDKAEAVAMEISQLGAGIFPRGSSIAYAVSKAGLNHLTKCMAVALAPQITVNCVAPGLILGTRMTANRPPDYVATAHELNVLHRPVSKDDIDEQVMLFCRSDSVTGQTLLMDCGRF